MSTSEMTSRWSSQSPFTRIAVSASIAFAVMLVLYFILTTSPTLVDFHAALYRMVETQERAWELIARSVVGFCIGMQLLIAYMCARASQVAKATGVEVLVREGYPWYGLLVVWSSSLLLAVANFSPDYFTVKGPDSWNIVGMVLLSAVIALFAVALPFVEAKESSTRNRVMYFTVGKWAPCLIYLALSQSKVVLTLVVGTFLLDILLHPVGVPPKMVTEETAADVEPNSDPEPQPEELVSPANLSVFDK